MKRIGPLAGQLIGDGGEKPVARYDALPSGVEQGEAAGAVSRLQHAGLEAGLADGRRLLVAGDAAYRDRAAEQLGHGRAVERGAVLDLRQHRSRHIEDRQELVVEASGVNVEQQGARGVGGVGGVDLAAGEAPDREAVDRAEAQFAACRAFPGAGDRVEHPGRLGAGEIGVEDEPGLGGDPRLVAGALELLAAIGGAAILPDDGTVDRPAGVALPDQRGLALIGDADGGDRGGADSGLGDGVAARRQDSCPDLLGLMLDEAGTRKMLGEFLLRHRHHLQPVVEDDGPRRCRSLIDGEHMGAHGVHTQRKTAIV
jgi:hypothetical protein